MQSLPEAEHHEPERGAAAVFYLKTRLLILRRWWQERRNPVAFHARGRSLVASSVSAEIGALLWTQITEAEFPLTAGKVQNLRAACLLLDGVEVPAGQVFSFWKQLGRTTRRKGFTKGRELRSGCLVPSLGGGLCQLSGLIHAAALDAGLTVLESHPHSRRLPGEPLPPERDATVFWNYVDLRFAAAFDWRLECRLTATDLVVSIRTAGEAVPRPGTPRPASSGSPVRADADGDCLTCGMTSCFRHPSAVSNHAAASGQTAWLLDGCWPEFNDWCLRHAHDGDHWFTPLDGRRCRKANYAWRFPAEARVYRATLETLIRSWRQRRLPAQGAARQQFLLDAQRDLAARYVRHLDPKARHLVVSQTLLPHLWLGGHLGGRSFDVLVQRWPLSALHARLDAAAQRHPASDTLSDFRAEPVLVDAEMEALAAAARLVTPHRQIAASFGARAILLDWEMPSALPVTVPSTDRWFFPASALGRKGIYELAAALKGSDSELLILGGANEGSSDPLSSVSRRRASVSELTHCTALVLPAWIEHEPRLALRALASGIPVIASTACGLPQHSLLLEIEAGDDDALKKAMQTLSARSMAPSLK